MAERIHDRDEGECRVTRRRAILGGAGVLVAATMAGCGGGPSEPATVEAELIARAGGEEAGLVEGDERTIEPGDFYGREFSLEWEHEIEYAVEVTEGPDVNVYLIERTELDGLRDEGDFDAIEDAMWPAVGSVSDTVTLSEGEYWLVVINADVEPANA